MMVLVVNRSVARSLDSGLSTLPNGPTVSMKQPRQPYDGLDWRRIGLPRLRDEGV